MLTSVVPLHTGPSQSQPPLHRRSELLDVRAIDLPGGIEPCCADRFASSPCTLQSQPT